MFSGTNIKCIEFSDGTSLTFEQAARRIHKENKLCAGYWIKSGLRPATGVLEEWTRCGNTKCQYIESHLCYTPNKKRRLLNGWFAVSLASENDRGITETVEEHCYRIEQWLRGFKRQ
jgi:hypothetical protein